MLQGTSTLLLKDKVSGFHICTSPDVAIGSTFHSLSFPAGKYDLELKFVYKKVLETMVWLVKPINILTSQIWYILNKGKDAYI